MPSSPWEPTGTRWEVLGWPERDIHYIPRCVRVSQRGTRRDPRSQSRTTSGATGSTRDTTWVVPWSRALGYHGRRTPVVQTEHEQGTDLACQQV
jgi:hypothetical protein